MGVWAGGWEEEHVVGRVGGRKSIGEDGREVEQVGGWEGGRTSAWAGWWESMWVGGRYRSLVWDFAVFT